MFVLNGQITRRQGEVRLKKKKTGSLAAAAVATRMQWESPGRGHWSAAAAPQAHSLRLPLQTRSCPLCFRSGASAKLQFQDLRPSLSSPAVRRHFPYLSAGAVRALSLLRQPWFTASPQQLTARGTRVTDPS